MNRIFRRMIPLMLAFLCCTACTNTKDAVTDPSPLVADAYRAELTYTGNVYNEQTGNYEDTSILASYHIPKIQLSGDAISEINTELYDALYPDIQNSVSEIEEYGFPNTSEGISYHWAENGDILSLVTDNRKKNDCGHSEYFVYNISISSGTLLSNEDVITGAGFSEEEYCELAEQVLGSFYWNGFDPSDENFEGSNFVDFFNDTLQKTISQDNIAQSIPYINEQGQLCVVAKIYSVAGADYYWHDLNMIDFELNPNYNKNAICSAESDKDTSLFASMPTEFTFSSGAGGWGTTIELGKDGSFTGQFHDSDMGDTGPDYPNGTFYNCSFSGKFSTPVKVDDYTYSMRLEYLNVDGTVGEVSYKDGMKYVSAEPYGMDDADTFFVYLPGSRLSDLPQGFVRWLRGFMDIQTTETLPMHGIYNVGGDEGFVASK